MSNLSVGNFTTVASTMVKSDEETNCVICCASFAPEDDVIEL